MSREKPVSSSTLFFRVGGDFHGSHWASSLGLKAPNDKNLTQNKFGQIHQSCLTKKNKASKLKTK